MEELVELLSCAEAPLIYLWVAIPLQIGFVFMKRGRTYNTCILKKPGNKSPKWWQPGGRLRIRRR